VSAKVSRRVIARTIAAKLFEQPDKRAYWVQVLAAYLVDTNRTDELDMIVNDIAHELYEQRQELVVNVTSARAITEQVRRELKTMLKDATNAHEVYLSEAVDPDLLGGLVARTPDAWLDVSVRTKLKQLMAIK